MAYFSKEAYEGKQKWADRRMAENKKIESLTEEQHEALSDIAKKRHDLHINFESAFLTESSKYDDFNFYPSEWEIEDSEIVKLINENNLPEIKIHKRTYNNWINDQEFHEEMKELNIDSGTSEYNEKLNYAKEITNDTLNLLDQDVRDYLAYIDYLYGTNYAPNRATKDKYMENSNIKQKGGMIKGKSHKKGGEHFEVIETGQQIEAEGGEPVISNDALKSNKVKTYIGTNKQILNQINKEAGASGMTEKADELHAGDFVICKRSAQDKTKRKITGTPEQVVSAINQSGGCKIEKTGAKVEKAKEGKQIDDNNRFPELEKGIEVESEHKNLYKKIKNEFGDKFKMTEKEFYAEIAKEHIKENPEYYDILEKQGLQEGGEIKESDPIILQTIDELVEKLKINRQDKETRNELEINFNIYLNNVVVKNPDKYLMKAFDIIAEFGGKFRILFKTFWEDYQIELLPNLTKNIWDLMPEKAKRINLPKKVSFQSQPNDLNLAKITSSYTLDDPNRPPMQGVNFDEHGICATDESHLLFIATEPKKRGLFLMGEKPKELKDRFPAYRSVIPMDIPIIHTINSQKLAELAQAQIKIELYYYVIIKYGTDQNDIIGIKKEFLLQAIKTMHELGYNDDMTGIDIGFINPYKAIIIAPKGMVNKSSDLNTDFIEIMPMHLDDTEKSLYYDLTDNTIKTTNIESEIKQGKMETAKETPEKVTEVTPEIEEEIREEAKKEMEKKRENIISYKPDTDIFLQVEFPAINKLSTLDEYIKERKIKVYKEKTKIEKVVIVNDETWKELTNDFFSDEYNLWEQIGGSECSEEDAKKYNIPENTNQFYNWLRDNRELWNTIRYTKGVLLINDTTKERIVINTEGYNYARYVGFPEISDVELFKLFLTSLKGTNVEVKEPEEQMTEEENSELAPSPQGKREKITAKNQYEINKQIEELVAEKGTDRNKYSDEEIQLLRRYSGVGGLKKQYQEEIQAGKIKDYTGFLYEFYTPNFIVEKMWALAYKYGFSPSETTKILEPSCAIGNFFKYAPKNCKLFGFEINKTSYTICRVLFPKADIKHQSFEAEFYMGRESKQMVSMRYDLIIGNPPYAEYQSEYSTEERKITKAQTWDQYFIMRGADSLLPDGLMIYIIPSTFLKNSDKYNEFKEFLLTKVDLIDAYRLPINSFDFTEIGTDIVVFRKK